MLKLFRPVVCCKELQRWTCDWNLEQSWANFFKFQCYTARKISKKNYYVDCFLIKRVGYLLHISNHAGILRMSKGTK